jgi:hypothetical protein
MIFRSETVLGVWVSCTLARSCLDCDHKSFFIHIISHAHYAFALFFARTYLITLFLAYGMHLQDELHQVRVDLDDMRLTRHQLFSLNDDIATKSDKVDSQSRDSKRIKQAPV